MELSESRGIVGEEILSGTLRRFTQYFFLFFWRMSELCCFGSDVFILSLQYSVQQKQCL